MSIMDSPYNKDRSTMYVHFFQQNKTLPSIEIGLLGTLPRRSTMYVHF